MGVRNVWRIPVQHGDIVLVYNHENKLVDTFATSALTKACISMSEEMFFMTYGFYFEPTRRYNITGG